MRWDVSKSVAVVRMVLVHVLCRQLVGDVTAVGMLVRTFLVKGGEGDGGNNISNDVALLGLQLWCNLIVVRDQDFKSGSVNNSSAVHLGGGTPRSLKEALRLGENISSASSCIQLMLFKSINFK